MKKFKGHFSGPSTRPTRPIRPIKHVPALILKIILLGIVFDGTGWTGWTGGRSRKVSFKFLHTLWVYRLCIYLLVYEIKIVTNNLMGL